MYNSPEAELTRRIKAIETELAELRRLAAPRLTWVTYTPTWTGTGSNPVIGANGTLTGAYIKAGRFVSYRFSVTMGAATTYGTGVWEFSIPIAAAADWRFYPGSAFSLDTGTADYPGSCRLDYTTQKIRIYTPSAAGSVAAAGPTTPHTWASTDVLIASIIYPAAS